MIDKKMQAEVDMLMAKQKLKWSAVTPDGKKLEWYPTGACITGDAVLCSEVESLIELKPQMLKLSQFQILPSDISNPYSVKLALEILYNGKGAIKYFGNEPYFSDVIVEIPESAVE